MALSGTRVDRDRPTRKAAWPGEGAEPAVQEAPILNREVEFTAFVAADVARRGEEEAELLRDGEGEAGEPA
ncbi:MAG: hypothetical protein ACYCUM_09220 [Solirubrobacteraceae bacterium]